MIIEQEKIVFCNPIIEKLFDIQRIEILKQDLKIFNRFLSFENQELLENKICNPKILSDIVIEFKLQEKKKWIEIKPKYINIGNNRFYLLIFNDISGYYLEFQKLKQEKSELESFIDNTPDLIWIVDTKNNIIRVNSAARATLFSLFHKDFSVNQKFVDNLPIDIQGIWKSRFRQSMDGNNIVVSDDFKSNGQKIYYEFSFIGHSEEGIVTRISVIGRDITDFKKLMEQLKESNINRGIQINDTIQKLQEEIKERKVIENNLQNAINQAEAANRAKIDFLANMSHELRTPLNAIIGFSDLLAMEVMDLNNNQINEFIENIGQSGKNLLSIISEILELTNIESGHIEIIPSVINLNNLLCTILEKFSDKIKNKNLIPSIEICEESLIITSDEKQLSHIIENLLDNAIKFTPENKEIGIKVNRTEDFYIFTIWDTGIGIANEHLGLIFEPFKQIENAFTKKYGGTGLGLYLCRKIIDLLGGKIWVESKKNVGSQFKFSLPIIKDQDKQDEPIKILFIGLDNAGKSSLIEFLTKSIITEKYQPSSEVRSVNHQYMNKKLMLLDTPGQKIQRVMWDRLSEQANVIVFVIDASDKFRYKEVESELSRLFIDPLLQKIPIMITFHKFDLESAVSSIGTLRTLIQSIIKDRDVQSVNTSIYIPETVEKLQKMIYKVI